MKNQLAVLEWNRTEIMRGRRLADRLRLRWPAARKTALNTHTAHQVTFADGIQTIPRSDSAHTACKTAEVSSVQSDTEDADCALLEASAGVSCGQSQTLEQPTHSRNVRSRDSRFRRYPEPRRHLPAVDLQITPAQPMYRPRVFQTLQSLLSTENAQPAYERMTKPHCGGSSIGQGLPCNGLVVSSLSRACCF